MLEGEGGGIEREGGKEGVREREREREKGEGGYRRDTI